MARYRVYGITIETEEALAVPLPPSDGPPDLVLSIGGAPDDVSVDDLTPTYAEGTRADGLPHFAYHRLPDRDVVQLTGAMDFHCWADRIHCDLRVPEHRYLFEIALFGMVLALWLERAGRFVVHASAVVVRGHAVAFCSPQGGGKTSTVTAFMRGGFPLLSDDLVAIEGSGSGMLAQPGFPQLRLWPHQVRHFVEGADELEFPTFHPGHDKRRVTIDERIGRFRGEPAPIARLYLPRRTDAADAEPVITPLAPRHAAMALVTNSYLPREMGPLGLQPRRLAFIAELLRQARVATVIVPNGLDQLPRVVSAVEDDLRDAGSVE